jgi:hypothetical protein
MPRPFASGGPQQNAASLAAIQRFTHYLKFYTMESGWWEKVSTAPAAGIRQWNAARLSKTPTNL